MHRLTTLYFIYWSCSRRIRDQQQQQQEEYRRRMLMMTLIRPTTIHFNWCIARAKESETGKNIRWRRHHDIYIHYYNALDDSFGLLWMVMVVIGCNIAEYIFFTSQLECSFISKICKQPFDVRCSNSILPNTFGHILSIRRT